jgi:CheY-like chemotaxis protein
MLSPDTSPHSVLVVDDDQAVGAVIEAILAAYGYDVITAAGALEALRLVQDFPGKIGVVITGFMIPNAGGLELCRRLKLTCPDLPVLLTSTFLSPGIADCLGDRVRFLQKPFTPHALIEMVAALLPTRRVPVIEAKSHFPSLKPR